ncbi:hypothetical protein PG997_011715 [Apiospora hydei]|uniref:Uncharacterized protein n=1 Tax=Apiospora hydei TaxID=1337664 RepID=A0ABR1V4P4_9PEZI
MDHQPQQAFRKSSPPEDDEIFRSSIGGATGDEDSHDEDEGLPSDAVTDDDSDSDNDGFDPDEMNEAVRKSKSVTAGNKAGESSGSGSASISMARFSANALFNKLNLFGSKGKNVGAEEAAEKQTDDASKTADAAEKQAADASKQTADGNKKQADDAGKKKTADAGKKQAAPSAAAELAAANFGKIMEEYRAKRQAEAKKNADEAAKNAVPQGRQPRAGYKDAMIQVGPAFATLKGSLQGKSPNAKEHSKGSVRFESPVPRAQPEPKPNAEEMPDQKALDQHDENIRHLIDGCPKARKGPARVSTQLPETPSPQRDTSQGHLP